MCDTIKLLWKLLINVILPILIGAITYYLFFPEAVFVGFIDKLLGIANHIPINANTIVLQLIRFYLLDFLWAYALIWAVILTVGINKALLITILTFEIMLEVIQLFPSIRGTFDVCDIVIEILASILGIYLSRRRLRNEEN